ncbi:hypothetical protein HKX54_02300 [Sulfitobacter sp. M57]|uniref:hypothetical protein n=1 Tax=unclassified Sulfitobacter TaxID=196795 RepID=UPI0023E1196F|nr:MULTISPECIES: hypothetical protein [unclassified Sulfitobacter]MDF3413273.1 hypothetical protein [Sulfitobacter sp. KE5]MDF3421446.1 hypothetical protein [Sulfitobacter sp. KE43]MDF3431820.1 hypothetical protein [Sulfitobacter sp. KE42]MDF3457460.1 hypothetical protein [Sulfitobacter sp. S74]MDF3461363.1 hypothetical protein [Sulfitobacter sp. Ks18]
MKTLILAGMALLASTLFATASVNINEIDAPPVIDLAVDDGLSIVAVDGLEGGDVQVLTAGVPNMQIGCSDVANYVSTASPDKAVPLVQGAEFGWPLSGRLSALSDVGGPGAKLGVLVRLYGSHYRPNEMVFG